MLVIIIISLNKLNSFFISNILDIKIKKERKKAKKKLKLVVLFVTKGTKDMYLRNSVKRCISLKNGKSIFL